MSEKYSPSELLICLASSGISQSISASVGPTFSKMLWIKNDKQYLHYGQHQTLRSGIHAAARFNYFEKKNYMFSGEIRYLRLAVAGTEFLDDGDGPGEYHGIRGERSIRVADIQAGVV